MFTKIYDLENRLVPVVFKCDKHVKNCDFNDVIFRFGKYMREYTYHSGNFLEIKYMYYLRELIGCKKSIQKKKNTITHNNNEC